MIGKRQNFGRNEEGNVDYRWIELDEGETKEVLGECVDWNVRISAMMESIIQQVKANLVEEGLIDSKKDLRINRKAIYDAVKVDSFTILKNKLDKKISDKLDEKFKKPDVETEPVGSGSNE